MYEHTQTGWPMRFAFASSALLCIVLSALPELSAPVTRAFLLAGAVLAGALGFAWSRLTIEIGNEYLRWRYGLGWPRFSLALAEITDVEATQTTFWQGWGIHRTRAGWLYNIAGRDAIIVTRRDGRKTLLGTDEPRRLKAALDRALARSTHERLRV
jgi:hypothetical protein